MRRKILLCVIISLLCLSACSKNTERTQTVSSDKEESIVETTTQSEVKTTESATVEISKKDNVLLMDIVQENPNGEISYLVNNVINNTDLPQPNIPNSMYMTSQDENGNRILGEILLYSYSLNTSEISTNEEFCKWFINEFFSELNDNMGNVEIIEESGFHVESIIFEDYTVVLIPDNDKQGMTFSLSPTK